MFKLFSDKSYELSIVYIATGSVIVLRQVMVALKYGYYTKKKWEKMKTTTVSFEYIINNMIIKA